MAGLWGCANQLTSCFFSIYPAVIDDCSKAKVGPLLGIPVFLGFPSCKRNDWKGRGGGGAILEGCAKPMLVGFEVGAPNFENLREGELLPS